MFDFKSLAASGKSDAPDTLAGLFSQLDRKATHTSLRPVQTSALNALDAQAKERDTVIKLSTGSGKTVVGLVYAEMMRRRYKGEAAVYLCPTNQLVDQVVQTGTAIGVKVSTFPPKGPPFDAWAGETVLACTYDRLFNSRSTFVKHSVKPSRIVLDDVHAGIERVRGSYTTKLPGTLYDQVKQMLQPLCEATDPATWRAIDLKASDAWYEVPFWIWANVHKQVAALMAPLEKDDKQDMFFTWGNMSRYAELCRVCISGKSIELSLPVAASEENASYSAAKHRLFMSASIKDGSSMMSDLGCDPAAFTRLIEPSEDEGAGERMILPTSLISPGATKEEVAAVCATARRLTNVVVLTSSSAQGTVWTSAGATLAERNDVDTAIETLKKSTQNFFVFPQRFDGVDLPDDACRVLVIDGVPAGDRLCDRIDAERQKDSPEYDVRTVNRFEQALGRAVRSSADYAAVLLVGNDIAAFIGKKSVRDLLEGRTRVQVDLGRDLAKMKPGQTIQSIVPGMISALLTRDEGWKEAHRARVGTAPKTTREGQGLTVHETVAIADRQSWILAKARNFQAAVAGLSAIANDARLHPLQKAEILYRLATYMQQFDPAQATTVYRSVFDMNSNFPRPAMVADKKFQRVREQAVSFAAFYGQFDTPNAAIAKLEEIKAKLSFGMPADVVEQGLLELGVALGAEASRPERQTGRGPDDLWIFDDAALCIEAKSEKRAPISKADAGQLSLSYRWAQEFVDIDQSKVFPLFATDVAAADRPEDVQFGPLQLTEVVIFDLVEQLQKIVVGLTFDGPLFTDPATIGKALAAHGLTGQQIVGRLVKIK